MQKTSVNGITSDWIEIHQGFPRGKSLGKTLFNFYFCAGDLEPQKC